MRFTRLSLWVLAAITRAALAGEGEGGGGGEGKGAAPPREQREFTEKTNKMNSLAGKIEEAGKHFEELAREKSGSREEREARRREMVEVSRQRARDEAEYAKLKTELAQRYPNHGERGRRAGEASAEGHGEPRGEAHGEGAAEAAPPGLDGLLRETKALIDRTYAPFRPPVEGDRAARAPAGEGAARPAPRLRLER